MKTKIIISLLGLLLIAGAFDEGCEEEEPKPDYITVNVTADRTVLNFGDCIDWLEGLTVRIDIVKAGGETFTFERATDQNCRFAVPSVSFKLYREQRIVATARVQGGIQGYGFIPAKETLSWSDVYPGKDFGETYAWETILHVSCVNN